MKNRFTFTFLCMLLLTSIMYSQELRVKKLDLAKLGVTDRNVIQGYTVKDIGTKLGIPAYEGVDMTVRYDRVASRETMVNSTGQFGMGLQPGKTSKFILTFSERVEGVKIIFEPGFLEGEQLSFNSNSESATLTPSTSQNGVTRVRDYGFLNIWDRKTSGYKVHDYYKVLKENVVYTASSTIRVTIENHLDARFPNIQVSGFTPYIMYRDEVIPMTDTDGDGITDDIDLDDDNDGILDTDENLCTETGNNIGLLFGSELNDGILSNDKEVTTSWESGNVTGGNLPSKASYSGASSEIKQRNLDITTGIDGAATLSISGGNVHLVKDTTKEVSEVFGVMYEFDSKEGVSITYSNVYDHLGNQLLDFSDLEFFRIGFGYDDPVSNPNVVKITNPKPGVFVVTKPGTENKVYYRFKSINGNFLQRYDASISGASPGDYIGHTLQRRLKCIDLDTDNDGIPNRLDLDSDGDGCSDAIEGAAGFTNSDLVTSTINGGSTNVQDNLGNTVDTDGIPTVANGGQAIGSSQDATVNSCDTGIDTDGDGITDDIDLDDDNDGIPDSVENATATNNGDTDGDGIPDSLDLDSDNDGIPDLKESGIPSAQIAVLDTNNDGVIDTTVDVGTNGIADSLEPSDRDGGTNSSVVDYDNDGTNDTAIDTDGDGIPDFQDLDSDNDGITDLVEGGTDASLDENNDGVIDATTDTDNDGIADAIDSNTTDFGGLDPNKAPDTDGDGVDDYRDLDSDDDGINDVTEANIPDTDGDGQDDTPNTSFVDGNNLPDSDVDGTPDYQEPNGAVITGEDTDGDGIKDSVDGLPNEFGDAVAKGTVPDLEMFSQVIPNRLEGEGFVSMIFGVREVLNADTTSAVVVSIPNNLNGSYEPFDDQLTELSGVPVKNSEWVIFPIAGFDLYIHVDSIEGLNTSNFGIKFNIKADEAKVSIFSNIQSGSGGDSDTSNNASVSILEVQ